LIASVKRDVQDDLHFSALDGCRARLMAGRRVDHATCPLPFEMVTQLADNPSQLVRLLRMGVDLPPHPPDLHLLEDHDDQESDECDDNQHRPQPKAQPWSSFFLNHRNRSMYRS
jgi:hypothetical protein